LVFVINVSGDLFFLSSIGFQWLSLISLILGLKNKKNKVLDQNWSFPLILEIESAQ
jgi:hypothetical protein